MTEQDKKGLEKALNDYIELKRSQAECTGFIDGFEKAIEYMNQGLLLPKHDVSKRFWHFDTWDKNGRTETITIEALNEENATIILKALHEDVAFDKPY